MWIRFSNLSKFYAVILLWPLSMKSRQLPSDESSVRLKARGRVSEQTCKQDRARTRSGSIRFYALVFRCVNRENRKRAEIPLGRVFGGRSISRKSIGGKEKLLYSAYYDGHQH
ncbi:hypothetical protein MGG_14641 [Pyricularia oryzae 70-15]|uniref:Secreted protein n=1 Tax=Pyricularia oryzae (strain 70-15 / ATCC MYA-4617 / FGSC 8958) TaxID=242507 RepID=G4ND49_PYRO7|nr:uncharacterized protein MGG_14641 [Pyricularia oryzae 70-15]EHA48391.1 hypothetical protein MGG_14641 [Pyricularia oryzae 70-15]